MVAYLVSEDETTLFTLEDKEQWIIGRDQETCDLLFEDPMASRNHAKITLENGLYYLENLSETNPLQVNGSQLEGKHLLQEEDNIHLANGFYKFTLVNPQKTQMTQEKEEPDTLESSLSFSVFSQDPEAKWLIKIIAGPNHGAEFMLIPGESHILGKDPSVADLIFQDLSVSKKHAKINLSPEGNIEIEDLQSKNGVFVNGTKITHPHSLHSQDLVSIGTTSFLLINKDEARETIFSDKPLSAHITEGEEVSYSSNEDVNAPITSEKKKRHWKETIIPTRHLIIASTFCVILLVSVISLLALFKSQTIVVSHKDETHQIETALESFPAIQFTYNQANQTLFLVGHLLTDLDYNEMLYLLNNIPNISKIENNVIIDESLLNSTNAMLINNNPQWNSIMVIAISPGKFAITGFLESNEESQAVVEYLQRTFPYASLLDNQIVIENTLHTQIQNQLLEKGFLNVSFQYLGGELILGGRISTEENSPFTSLITDLQKLKGVRAVKNLVLVTHKTSTSINLTNRYSVTGTSKVGTLNQFVLINGKILTIGDQLDGMQITKINNDSIQLDKDGIHYSISYNPV